MYVGRTESQEPQFFYKLKFIVMKEPSALKARIITAVKNIEAPMLTRVLQELECRIDVFRVTRDAQIEHL
jgi:hypothetical protein